MSRREEIRTRRKKARQRRRLVVVLAIAGVAMVFAAILILPNLRGAGNVVTPPDQEYPMAEGTAMGDPDAPVTIVEYSDFQCPFCRRFHEETLPDIIDEYVADGEVYFEYRNFAFIGPESVQAANASYCAADQDRFWDYAATVFANQTGENVGAYSDQRLLAFGEEIGLDMDQFTSCVTSGEFLVQVEQDRQAAQQAGVTSTPSFLVNGQLLTGALPFSDFQQVIEAHLPN